MAEPIILGAALLLGFVVAFTIGANDETMTPAVGAGLLSLSVAVIIGGIFNFIGVFFLGESVSKTVGKGISTAPLELDMIFVILISMALWLFIVSIKGVPISSTQSVIGSVLGVIIVRYGWDFLNQINFNTLFEVVASWVVSPVIGLIGGYFFYWLIMRFRQSIKTTGYSDYERQEKIASYALALFLLFSVFSRSGNDVAKAIGPLMALDEFSSGMGLIYALVAGGLGMCIGVILLGRRVVKKLSSDIVALSPTSALAASVSVSLIMFFGTLMGMPLSGSHILVAAFIGVGFVNKEKMDKDSLKEIGISWVITTPISAIFSAVIFIIFTLLGDFFIALYL
ncbi:MAG: inorganic phosphate transporter [Candidatus Heimdallarchaeota archaeon]|nr:MAG: inorganic phosphate transporter [Candidatus Heimdallarchaeota archaeon]